MRAFFIAITWALLLGLKPVAALAQSNESEAYKLGYISVGAGAGWVEGKISPSEYEIFFPNCYEGEQVDCSDESDDDYDRCVGERNQQQEQQLSCVNSEIQNTGSVMSQLGPPNCQNVSGYQGNNVLAKLIPASNFSGCFDNTKLDPAEMIKYSQQLDFEMTQKLEAVYQDMVRARTGSSGCHTSPLLKEPEGDHETLKEFYAVHTADYYAEMHDYYSLVGIQEEEPSFENGGAMGDPIYRNVDKELVETANPYHRFINAVNRW